ncbi:MAG: type II toxin-antitoxin system ParD family antitoxin [Cyanobacteria bacterium P01_G01_bin.54]
MNVTFSPDLARLLTEQVAQGVYPSVNVAVDETVRLLLRQRSRDKDRFEELRQEILLGVQDSERGNVIEVAQLRDRSLQ